MNIPFPEYIRRIIACLADSGYDSYAVGGCIRDSILGRVPHDWDVTTAAVPEEVIRVFSEGDIHVIGTAGIRHGTVMVKAGANVCEITTFRSDGDYNDHRRPDSVTFSKSVEDDLSRRDFTMNAIAAKPDGSGTVLIDPFDGRDDISAGVIRTVGDPVCRFTEDALRIMRAVRFSAELGFTVEDSTANAAIEFCDTLRYVSAERITTELWRTLSAEYAPRAVQTFSPIFNWITPNGLPERFLRFISKTSDPYVRLALMSEHGSDCGDFFSKMRFSGKTISLVKKLVSIDDPPNSRQDVCHLMREFGDRFVVVADYLHVLKRDSVFCCDFLAGGDLLREAQDIIDKKIPYQLSQLSVNGSDLIAAGIPNEKIGTVLEYLLAEVQKGIVPNEQAALMAYLKLR